jgi:hypothetical protein
VITEGIRIEGDWETELREFAADLALVPNGLETAVARAINKTLQGARTDAVNMIRRDFRMKASDIRKLIKIERAYPTRSAFWGDNLWGRLYGSGPPGLPLIRFRIGSTRVPSTRRLKSGAYRPVGGISVRVRKDRGRQVVKGAFAAIMPSGHVGVFRRVPGSQMYKSGAGTGEQIEELFGPSPVKLLTEDRYDDEIGDRIDERMEKNLKHEAENVLRQAGVRW